MRRSVLADSGAILALFLERDQAHAEAKRILERILLDRRPLLTTSDVFDEVVTLVRRWAGYERAVHVGNSLRGSVLLSIVGVDDGIRQRAWELFRRHRLPGLSHTDCTSAAVMEKFGIPEAFTFGGDFRRMGYSTIPDANTTNSPRGV